MAGDVSEQFVMKKLSDINKSYKRRGVSWKALKNASEESRRRKLLQKKIVLAVYLSFFLIPVLSFSFSDICSYIITYMKGLRCIVPNNYFVWEATRQISDCSFCVNLTDPIILQNVSKEEFEPYAYSSKPIIVRRAFLHWPAMTVFDFQFFQNLYGNNAEAFKTIDEECQFLHFKSDFTVLKDVFSMNNQRILNRPGEKSWYVGWGNCHPEILSKMRQYYPKPHFLPDDCEMPSKDYVFMGYGAGATMHLDFINRLMWQAQLKGTKTWFIKPTPECENKCNSLSFSVNPGDAVLLDTRVWYHGTTVNSGEFSLSIQSEYG